MSEIKMTVPAKIIATLKHFASDEDVRNYLNGINLEIGATESRIVATNGAYIGCFRVECEQPEVNAPLTNIIIPKKMLNVIKPKGFVEITIGALETEDNEKGEKVPVSLSRPVTLTYGDVQICGKTLNERFPDFRRVIPSKVTGEPAQFNPLYVGELGKAYRTLHGNKLNPAVGIGFNGQDAALIDLGDENFVGALMPLRTESVNVPKTAPDWWADSPRIATDSAQS